MALTHFERTHGESSQTSTIDKDNHSTKTTTTLLFLFSSSRVSVIPATGQGHSMATTSETPQVQGAIPPGVLHFLFYHGKTFHHSRSRYTKRNWDLQKRKIYRPKKNKQEHHHLSYEKMKVPVGIFFFFAMNSEIASAVFNHEVFILSPSPRRSELRKRQHRVAPPPSLLFTSTQLNFRLTRHVFMDGEPPRWPNPILFYL